MQILYRGIGTVNKVTGETISLAKPAAAIAGDLMLAVVTIEDATVIVNCTGWQKIADFTNTNGFQISLLWRVMVAGDAGPWAFATAGSNEEMGYIIAYSGTDRIRPIGNYRNSTSEAKSVSAVCPSIMIQTADNMALSIAGNMYGTTWTPPSGTPIYTERLDDRTNTGTTNISTSLNEAYYSSPRQTLTKTCTAAVTDYHKAIHVELCQPPIPQLVPIFYHRGRRG